MLVDHALPRITARVVGLPCVERRLFHLFGLPESAFADRAGDWMARGANPLVGVTASGGRLSVSVRAEASTRADAQRVCAARGAEIRTRFAEWIFSEDEPDLAAVVGRELIARNITVTLAESCTGGLAAERLTRTPGISAVFELGFVTYANRAKVELLGVDPALLAAHGAVSSQVAAAMARGAAERSGARLAASITGIAGPGGATPEKPVGLVHIGISADGVVTTEERRFLDLGRDLIRDFATNTVFDLLRRALVRLPRDSGAPTR